MYEIIMTREGATTTHQGDDGAFVGIPHVGKDAERFKAETLEGVSETLIRLADENPAAKFIVRKIDGQS